MTEQIVETPRPKKVAPPKKEETTVIPDLAVPAVVEQPVGLPIMYGSVQDIATPEKSCNCAHKAAEPIRHGPFVKPSERFDRELETKMVKCMFYYIERPGSKLIWDERFPWKGAKMKTYTAKDQQMVDLPYYVARRLKEKGYKPVVTVLVDQQGRPMQHVSDYKKRWDIIGLTMPLPESQRARLTHRRSNFSS